MFSYLLMLVASILCAEISANSPIVAHERGESLSQLKQNINKMFDTMLNELTRAEKVQEALRTNYITLERENEELRTIKAELLIAQKDLQRSMENEAAAQQKLARLQQQAGKELNQMRNEFDAFKNKLETASSNFDKVFW